MTCLTSKPLFDFTTLFFRNEDEHREFFKLEEKFSSLEKFKRDTIDNLKKKLAEHDDRIYKLEGDHSEMRSNNDRDHQ
jgi:tryptophanyl-tRNA synthetase